ncbi:YdeI/OmpD-associated family protein [Staphylococcus sp. SQ8-PEA]|uniref:YdeI/OmpD-associated family protein n=1 Tax=Staphylococcus marylandisciuri TaxID=2981529 RepID=A0ABT2QMV8_9STAP|nr:YdeI/OmpD-associated family protein [Staphylococcus marylandisciuri]MCU5745311.1 YdeI/OmpD-associated family protein [Staphylococcus marylandisciuri]
MSELTQWQDEIKLLREIILHTELEEDYKWKHPCYTLNGKNVVIIQEFKHYCALLFEKGAIMDDAYRALVQQTKNVQAARQLRFESVKEIESRQQEIEWYIKEAIHIERSGKKVPMKSTAEYDMPEELADALERDDKFKEAFENLTPGRQRQYMYHIGQAKKSDTREKRVKKYYQHILNGKGMNDK